MNRKTLGALLVFLVLLGVVYYLQSRPEKGERVASRMRPLAPIDAQTIKRITIATKGSTVGLELNAQNIWQLNQPVAYPADQAAVNHVIQKIVTFEFGDMITELKSKHAEYLVDQQNGIYVQVGDQSKRFAVFYLGREIDNFTMFRLANQNQVYQLVGSLRNVFLRDIKNWRDRTIVSFKKEDARKLTAKSDAGTLVLSRTVEKAVWKVDHAPRGIKRIEQTMVNALLSSFASLRAFDFADSASAEQTELHQPQKTLTVELINKEQITLFIGNKNEDTYWVQKKGAPQIFTITHDITDHLLLAGCPD